MGDNELAKPAERRSTVQGRGPQAAVENYTTARLWVSAPTSLGQCAWGLASHRRYRGSLDRRLLGRGVVGAPPDLQGDRLIVALLWEALQSASGSLRA